MVGRSLRRIYSKEKSVNKEVFDVIDCVCLDVLIFDFSSAVFFIGLAGSGLFNALIHAPNVVAEQNLLNAI